MELVAFTFASMLLLCVIPVLVSCGRTGQGSDTCYTAVVLEMCYWCLVSILPFTAEVHNLFFF